MLFKQAVKTSFKYVKKDISTLEKGLEQLKEALLLQNQAIREINNKMDLLLTEKEENRLPLEIKEEKYFLFEESTSSIGNNGVKQTNKQALSKQALSTKEEEIVQNDLEMTLEQKESKQISKEKIVYTTEFKALKQNITLLFKGLSKQELRTFLTIYQLEDEKEEASYEAIAQQMELSEACVRGYAANLLKKGIPLLKIKINNKMTVFRIDKGLRDLNLKQKLVNLYYQQDLSQTQLFESL